MDKRVTWLSLALSICNLAGALVLLRLSVLSVRLRGAVVLIAETITLLCEYLNLILQ